ncbi:DUF3575 domain-containing protein [Spirosoma sp.]|uniref:DUF3575 domain-containing protein n=1 Tax=Spirosoma sp. TaxID=1899569 RepID=UPI003B3AA951
MSLRNGLICAQSAAARGALPAIIILTIMLSGSGYAQDTTRPWRRPNVLKTNLLAPISVFYERALSRQFAIQTSFRWWGFGGADDEHFVNATVEGRFYFDKLASIMELAHPTGFYISPYLKARSLRYVNKIGTGPGNPPALDEVKIRSIGFGLTFGYQWVFKRGLVLDAFFGGGGMPPALSHYQHTMRYSPVTSEVGYDYRSMDLRAGVNLGYAF